MRKSLAVAGLLFAAALATPAGAATIVATYTGTIYRSLDQNNFFGAGSGSNVLNGQEIIASFTFDSDIGTPVSDDTSRFLDGLNALNPFTAASVTINGHTEDMGSFLSQNHDDRGVVLQANEQSPAVGGLDRVAHEQYSTDQLVVAYFDSNSYDYLYADLFSFTKNIVNTADYTVPLNYAFQPDDSSAGAFETRRDGNVAFGEFTITSVTIERLGAVPEPATWAFMIVGFGFIGAAMRSARRIIASPAFA